MQFITAGLTSSLWATLLLFICVVAAGRLGGLALSLCSFHKTSLSRSELRIFSLGVGLSLLALGVLFLGSLQQLVPVAAWLLIVVFLLIPLFFIHQPNCFSIPTVDLKAVFSQWPIWVLLLVGSIFFLSWIYALTPPIGTDALSYHLSHPRIFIENQSIFYIPNTRESLWPYLTEMLFTLGLLIQGTTLAKLFHWIFFFLTTASIYLFGKRFFGAKVGRMAAFFFLLTPVAFVQSGFAYIDLSFAFYVLLSVYLLLLYQKERCLSFALGLGLFCGCALATKYLALGSTALLFLLFVVTARFSLKAYALFFFGCFLMAGAWYLRSWIVLGNPVYPFLPDFFGGQGVYSDIAEKGVGTSFFHFLTLPWNMTLKPPAFGGEMIGPLLLLFLPFLLLNRRKPPIASWWLVLFAVAYAGFLFTQSQQVRFFFSLMPLLVVGAGVGFEIAKQRSWALRKIAILAVVFVTILHLGIYGYRVRNAWGVAFGSVPAKTYLAQSDRSFKIYEYLQKHVQPDQKVFNAAEDKYFYNTTQMVIYNNLFRIFLKEQGKTLLTHLDENKYDYFYLSKNSSPELFDYANANGYKVVFSHRFTEKPKTFEYFIYKK